MVGVEYLRFGRKTARISNRMNTILATINECIGEMRLFPSLILFYSSIDILGSIQSPTGFTSRRFFKEWVDNYLFIVKPFSCTADDLYGARCGILHTMRYDSADTSLKEIVYGFYGYDENIRKITDTTRQTGIYIEDFQDALISAYGIYIEELENSTNPIVNCNIERFPNYVDLIPMN